MKRYGKSILAILLLATLVLPLSGCRSSGAEANAAEASAPAAVESAVPAPQASAQPEGVSNILIAYFTAAENSGVDAIASASYTTIDGQAVGRLRAVADMIQANTGGDLFSIRTSVIYPTDGGELIDYAAQEQDENARPELTSHIENLEQYDTIFIGYPNWWADLPMAVYSFFDEYDFSGKTIIPFNVHNGSPSPAPSRPSLNWSRTPPWWKTALPSASRTWPTPPETWPRGWTNWVTDPAWEMEKQR